MENVPQFHEEELTPEQLKKMGVEVPTSAIVFRDKENRVTREVDHYPSGEKKVDVEFDPKSGAQKHMIFFDEQGRRIREGFYNADGALDHWFEYNPNTGDVLKHDAQVKPHPELLKRYLRNQPWGKDTEEFKQ